MFLSLKTIKENLKGIKKLIICLNGSVKYSCLAYLIGNIGYFL